MSKNLVQRILVAAVAIPIILWLIYQGGFWLLGFTLLLAFVAACEFAVAEKIKLGSPLFLGFLLLILFSICFGARDLLQTIPSIDSLFESTSFLIFFLPLLLIFFLITAMTFATGKEEPSLLFARHARLTWGAIYLSFLYPFVFMLGQFPERHHMFGMVGGDCLLYLFALLWIGDTAAMWVGSVFGKHQLAPAVSPKKTIEGFIGGLIAAVIVGVAMHFWKFQSITLGHMVFMSALASVAGQLGDLVESMWKRSLGIKDSSAIIPGHGGVLDRFDSLLFAAPVVYAYLLLLIR